MEPTRDEQQAPGAPVNGRAPQAANPDTRPFWLKDLKVPIIREPSPVLGMAGLTPSYVPAASVVPTPVIPTPVIATQAPAPSVPAPPASAPSVPAPKRVPATTRTAGAPARRQRRQRRQWRWRSEPSRAPQPLRVRRTSLLRASGVLLAGLGLAVPFLLGGPFGDDSPTSTEITQNAITRPPAPTTIGTTSGVTASPTTTDTSPPTTRIGEATALPTRVTRTRDTRTSPRRTPTPRTTTDPATLPRNPPPPDPPAPNPPPPVQTTRPGEVLIRNAQYAGRPLADVRADLLALGVTPVENWVAGTGRPNSTVIEIRPSGWVPDRSIVYVWVAAS